MIHSDPFHLIPSFPQLFSKRINKFGLYCREEQSEDVDSIALVAALHSGPQMNTFYKKMMKSISFKARDDVLVGDFELGEFGTDRMEWAEVREYYEQLISQDEEDF
jgi:hypothetical protein